MTVVKTNKLASKILFYERIKKYVLIQIFFSFMISFWNISLGITIANFITKQNSSQFILWCLGLIISRFVLFLARNRINFIAYNNVRDHLIDEMFNKTATIDNLNFDSTKTKTTFQALIFELETYFTKYIPTLIDAMVVPLVLTLAILIVDFESSLIIIFTLPLIPIFMILIGLFTKDHQNRQWQGYKNLKQKITSLLRGIPTLKLLNKQKNIIIYAKSLLKQYNKTVMETLKVAFISVLALEALATLSIAVVAVTLGVRLTSGNVSLWVALFVLFTVPECYWPLRRLGSTFHSSEKGIDVINEHQDFLSLDSVIFGDEKIENVSSISSTGVVLSNGVNIPTLEIKNSEITLILGPNGVGKTTLFNTLIKRNSFETGEIFFNKLDINKLCKDFFEEQIAYVPQEKVTSNISVFEELKVYDVQDHDLFEIAKSLGIENILTKKLSSISGGQHKRVDIAKAFIKMQKMDCSIFIADEPTNGLDEKNKTIFWNKIKEYKSQGKIIILTSHDEFFIPKVDKVIEISQKVEVNLEDTRDVIEHKIVGNTYLLKKTDSDSEENIFYLRKMLGLVKTKLFKSTLIYLLADLFTLILGALAIWLILKASLRPQFIEISLVALYVRICGIGKAVFRYLERLTIHKSALDFCAKIQLISIKKIITLAPSKFKELQNAKTTKRIIDDHEDVQDLFVKGIIPFFSNCIIAIFISILAFLVDIKYGFLISFSLFVVISANVIVYRIYKNKGKNIEVFEENSIYNFSDLIDNLNINILFSRFKTKSRNIKSDLDKLSSIESKMILQIDIIKGVLKILPVLIMIFSYLIIKSYSYSFPIAGLLILFPYTVFQLFEDSIVSETFSKSINSINRLRELHSRSPRKIEFGNQEINLLKIELSNVQFSWDEYSKIFVDKLNVDDVNNKVLISGDSGKGKSTIAAGLVRFLPVDKGEYNLGDKDINNYSQQSIYKNIGLFMQEAWLFESTIKENILLGNPDLSDNEIISLLSDLDYKFCDEGINKNVGLDGCNLSGGEKQKVALARFFAHEHMIKIYDEPTTSLDISSRDKLLSKIAQEENKSILISHNESEILDHFTRFSL